MNPGDAAVERAELPRRPVAIASMFLAGLMFAAMSLCAKAAGSSMAGVPIPAAESTFVRFAFGTLVMLPLLRSPSARLLGEDRWGLTIRGVSGGFAVLAYFMAIEGTTLTHAVLLNFTSIIFAPLCALVMLRERIGGKAGLSLAVASIGIVLVTRPSGAGSGWGDAAGLVSGILAGVAITAIRRLRRAETASSVFFYFSAIGMPIAAVACLFQPMVWPTPVGWALLLAMAASSVAAQMLMTFGYAYLRTSEGVLMTLSQIVYSSVASALAFHEPLPASTVGGGLLILVAGAWAATASATTKEKVCSAPNPEAVE